MIKRMVIMLLIVGVVLGGLYGFQVFKAGIIKQVMAGIANPAQTVSTVVAESRDWQDKIEAVGTLKAINGADLALQVSGIVQDMTFQSGEKVNKGQVLLKLAADDDIAKLASLQATADNLAITLKRDQEQLKIKAVSEATVDSDVASLKNAQALVDQQKALVEQKTLRAPFSGRLGIRSVDFGQFLTAGTTIVTLQDLDSLYVDMYLPQKNISQLQVGQQISMDVDAYPGKSFAGTISAINSKVDSSTRNVQVRATMENRDGLLLPGMFGKVEIAVGTSRSLVTLPQTAVVYNPYGSLVFIIDKSQNADGKEHPVRQSFIKTGAVRGDNVSIVDGVKPGEEVVTAGQIKLRNGSRVVIDNSHVPTAEDNPVIKDQ
ncbi:MAG TPA: efflux RND transporter periplasmic adaptor subunit [Ensifer sp.]|nr:efflux RND transporter periplasmic adaptor subunit [Ensifer sp.]